jgi:hypothetical protein
MFLHPLSLASGQAREEKQGQPAEEESRMQEFAPVDDLDETGPALADFDISQWNCFYPHAHAWTLFFPARPFGLALAARLRIAVAAAGVQGHFGHGDEGDPILHVSLAEHGFGTAFVGDFLDDFL